MTTATDLFSSSYWDHAVDHAAQLRARAAVHHVLLPPGIPVWLIVRHREARAALADHRLGKSAADLQRIIRRHLVNAGHHDELSAMFLPHMLYSDGATHDRLRKLVTTHLTRTRILILGPQIERITRRLVESLPTQQPVDLIAEFAFPLPLSVICELLGIPASGQQPMREWTTALMHDDPSVVLPASHAMARYLHHLIDQKKTAPADDLLSALARSPATTEAELLGTAILLVVAGHETTTNLIGNAVRWLVADPALWQRLAADPSLVPAAVEEMLRFDGPVRLATHRHTTQPVTIDDITIPADEIVMISLQAANHDGRRFSCPHALDIQRETRELSGHLGFGHGIHYCLGSQLGRMEAVVALTQLVTRFPHARLGTTPSKLRRRESAMMNCYVDLPVVLASS